MRTSEQGEEKNFIPKTLALVVLLPFINNPHFYTAEQVSQSGQFVEESVKGLFSFALGGLCR